MKTIETKNNNWMLEIIEHYENSLVDATAGFTKTGQYNDNGNITPGTEYLEFESPEIEAIELNLGASLPVYEEGVDHWIKTRFQLFDEIKSHIENVETEQLKLVFDFEIAQKYGQGDIGTPTKMVLRISAEWQKA